MVNRCIRVAKLACAWALGLGLCACGGATAEREDRDRVLSALPIAKEADMEPIRGDLAAGLRFYKDEEYADAQASLERYLKGNPKSAIAYYHLGLIELDRGKPDAARKQFERALQLNPKLHGAANNLGVIYLNAGEDIAAMRAFQQAYKLAPNDPRVLVNLASAQMRRGLWSEAIDTYEEAYKLAPGHASIIYDFALAYVERQQWEPALKLIEEALRVRPRFALAWVEKVACLQGLGRIDEAIATGREALQLLSPVLVDNYVVLGRALVAKGLIKDALAEFRHAADLQPENAQAQLALGELLDAAGDKEAAAQWYGKYVKNPERSQGDARRIRDRLSTLQNGGNP